jgi:hypothetical protein
MSSSPSVSDLVSQLLNLRKQFEDLPNEEQRLLCVDFTCPNGYEPSNFAVADRDPRKDRFQAVALRAGRLLATIPIAKQQFPPIAKEQSPIAQWLRLLFELKPGLLYFSGEQQPHSQVKSPGPWKGGHFFGAITLSIKAVDKLVFLVEENGEGAGRSTIPPKGGGGGRRLEDSNPLKFQVYERIRRTHQPGKDYADSVAILNDDRDFIEQVKHAGLKKLDTGLVKNAVAFFDQREKARKKQETD